MSSGESQVYEFGPFVLNPSEQTLLREGRPVSLRPKVYDLLVVLVERPHHLFPKGELMDALWPGEAVEEGNLDKNISLLRRALGGEAYIETVPRRGYRFAAEVRQVCDEGRADELVVETRTRASIFVEETVNEEPPVAAAPALPAGKSERRFKRWAVLTAAAIVVAVAAAGYFFYPARGGEAIDSVAVLPLVNEGGDPETVYLSEGVSESLLNSLSQLPELKVIARSSSFKYRSGERDAREAARALGVAAILTGRVERRGGNLLISAELIDARGGTQLWGGRYDRPESELMAVQAEMSREVTRALRLRLTAGEQKQLAKRETANPVAYELLLKGRFYWDKGGTENLKKAIGYYQQATEADPAYALAYAQLSMAYSDLVNTMVLDPKEFTPKAELAARTALELDESLAEAHLAMSNVHRYAWEWADAEREHRRSNELNPNLTAAHRSYMFHLSIHGRNEEALGESRRARELDPLSNNTTPVYEQLLMRQPDQAIEAAKKLLEANPSNADLHALVAFTYRSKGQYPEAVAAYREAIRLGDASQDTQIFLGESYARVGEVERAREILRRLETGREYVSPAALAIIYAALGEREQALALLERAYSERDQQLVWMGVEGAFAPLHSDPRFQDLLRRVGVAQSRN